ncbi:hypothetical protein [Geminocystis sp. GBBB08]|uniref:hypothetical protein n=1 Tax=Geminocystis sp. GBBB08 TaxID=2604140 RepID=UPI0027E2F58D|nr:hypothetical protein [Geminocystis sp. GBBB08]
MKSVEYLTDINGNKKAVVIPIEIWEKIIPNEINNDDKLPEYIDNSCLNQAMEEAKLTPLLDAENALKFQENKIAKPGLHLGAISMAEDFDEPLSDSFWLG